MTPVLIVAVRPLDNAPRSRSPSAGRRWEPGLAGQAGNPGAGRAFVHLGHPSGPSSGGVLSLNMPLVNHDSTFFGSAAVPLYDANGDGYDDIAIGAPGVEVLGNDQGEVYLFHGASSGVSGVPVSTISSPSGTIGGTFGFNGN